ncbi:MAG TPA: hypothetical protein VMQ52_00415 [Candidatus Saccharimonadales bacterium]|jgi:hypothetical protein|nr:hypothetical protein [Candidatus Saccharimonadales bacterium]
MDKQDHNRIKSIKARPTTTISLNSGEAQPSDDALEEIRDDYRRAKEQLKRYNKFIDQHKFATVLIPLLLSLAGFIALLATSSGRSRLSLIIVIIVVVAIGLIPTAFILALVCGWRGSSKAKIEHRLKVLREEAAQYRRATALGEKNISRDELGLLQNDFAYFKGEEVSEESIGAISNKTKAPTWPWVLIIVIIIGAWFLYNRYTSGQRYDSERAYCVSQMTAQKILADPTAYCYSLPNSSLNSVYKVGQ